MAELNRRLEEQNKDLLPMNRFRGNIVVTDCAKGEEDEWEKFAIGSVEVTAVKPCDRCKVSTNGIHRLPSHHWSKPCTGMPYGIGSESAVHSSAVTCMLPRYSTNTVTIQLVPVGRQTQRLLMSGLATEVHRSTQKP